MLINCHCETDFGFTDNYHYTDSHSFIFKRKKKKSKSLWCNFVDKRFRKKVCCKTVTIFGMFLKIFHKFIEFKFFLVLSLILYHSCLHFIFLNSFQTSGLDLPGDFVFLKLTNLRAYFHTLSEYFYISNFICNRVTVWLHLVLAGANMNSSL